MNTAAGWVPEIRTTTQVEIQPPTQADALGLMRAIGAPPHLLTHLELVAEAASELVAALSGFSGLVFDAQLVEVGASVHDAGKIVVPSELYGPGKEHEAAGYELLRRHGVSPEVAQCCVSHGSYLANGITLEERLVALADSLWKGKREQALESLIIEEVADRVLEDRWSVYITLDDAFEAIAAQGDERLARSRVGSEGI